MFHKHRHTIAYAALSSTIALAAVIVWIAATGRYQLPPGIVVVFSVGAALIATGVERTMPVLRERRSARKPARHRKAAPSSPLAEPANGMPTQPATAEGDA